MHHQSKYGGHEGGGEDPVGSQVILGRPQTGGVDGWQPVVRQLLDLPGEGLDCCQDGLDVGCSGCHGLRRRSETKEKLCILHYYITTNIFNVFSHLEIFPGGSLTWTV